MRLNQRIGILLLLLVFTTMAAASTAQLTGVVVQAKGNATALTLRASGAFTHTEYRPSDNLLLVDLAGISPAKLENVTKELEEQYPGVKSYRILGYKGSSGAEITRVEMLLAANAAVKVEEAKNALVIHVTASKPASSPVETKPVAAAKPAPVKTTPKVDTLSAAVKTAAEIAPAAVTKTAQVRNVSVVRGKDGVNIDIEASGPIAPTALKLTAPNRVVVDIPNSMPVSRQRMIAVHNSDIKTIRWAQYQINPPITRVVIDLVGEREYRLSASGTHALLHLQGEALAVPMMAKATDARAVPKKAIETPAHPVATPAMNIPAVKVAATAPAQIVVAAHDSETPVPAKIAPADAVVVEPTVKVRAATPSEVEELTPAIRAATAASKFSSPVNEVPVTNANAIIRPEPAINLAQTAAQAPAAPARQQSAGCATGPYSGEQISVNLKEVDLRDFFRLVHEISGLNVVLDPLVKGSLTIVLDEVPWDQALAIVMKNNGLDCQLEGNILRIATTKTIKDEADARRAQLDAQALAVDAVTVNRYLSYAVAKDVVPTIKGFLSSRGAIIADERTNSLIISDIPSVVPNVDRLIKELDRKTQEVEIEARVVSATRNFARDIGTQLGFGFRNASTLLSGAQGSSTTLIRDTANKLFMDGTIPFFTNLGASAPSSGIGISNQGANYRLDYILTAAETRGLLKILSRPRIITQNNISAVVRQGQKIPIVTGAQLGGPPTVTFIDAFLRLTVRPQITAEGTIFLNVDVENTVPDFSRVTSAQLNPILVVQQATTQVLVSDGGTVVIGGVIQTQNNVTVNQVPFLGNIPVLGNLFKRRLVTTGTQELIFFITPKIIET